VVLGVCCLLLGAAVATTAADPTKSSSTKSTVQAAGGFVIWRCPGGDAKPPVLAFNTPSNPAKGDAVFDPIYHTQIRRVTDRAVDRYSSEAVVNEYARFDPENANGSRVLLRGTDGVWNLYSVPKFQRIRTVGFRGNPDPEPRWHPTDPDLVYYVEGPSLWEYDAATDKDRLIHDFCKDQPGCAFVRTKYKGKPSLDSRYWCLRLENADWRLLSVVCYDRQEDKIVGRVTNPIPEFEYVSMDMSGKHCLIYDESRSTLVSYHRDFTHPVPLPGGVGHDGLAYDAAGRDVLVYQNNKTDWIAMADLETGEETNLVKIPFEDNLDIGLHFSGNCDSKPGWVLVSTYGEQLTAKSWMDRSLFMVQLQANPTVWRVAQTFTVRDPKLEKDYFGEAFAAINRRGTRVWWGSNWNATGAENHRYEVYVAELPANWDASIPAQMPEPSPTPARQVEQESTPAPEAELERPIPTGPDTARPKETARAAAGAPAPDTDKPAVATSPAGTAASDADRPAARWALAVGGCLQIFVEDRKERIESSGKLPQETFQVVTVELGDNSRISDQSLANLSGLARLEELALWNTPISDAGLKNLRGAPRLNALYLNNTSVAGTGLESLKSLTWLELNGCPIDDSGLKYLKCMTGLEGLYLNDTKVSDAGLEVLAGLKKLREVHLENTRVTAAGISRLQSALPHCKITANPGNGKGDITDFGKLESR
jgi:hypothetical protein